MGALAGRFGVGTVVARLAVVTALAFSVLIGLMTAPASAETSTVTSVSGTTVLEDVTCMAPTSCVAVGWVRTPATDALAGVIVPITDGIPGDAETVADATNLQGVSCLNTTNCIAVGYAGTDAVVVPFNDEDGAITIGAIQTITTPGDPVLYGVACPGGTTCVAVGFYATGLSFGDTYAGPALVVTITKTTLSVTVDAKPAGEDNTELYRIACETTTTNCVAVGFLAFNTTTGDGVGVVLPIADGVAGTESTVPGTYNLVGVGCMDTSSCVADGNTPSTVGTHGTGVLVPITDGVPGTARTAPDMFFDGGSLVGTAGIACALPTGCVAVGRGVNNVGEVLAITDGVAGTPVTESGTNELVGVASTACTGYVAVGYAGTFGTGTPTGVVVSGIPADTTCVTTPTIKTNPAPEDGELGTTLKDQVTVTGLTHPELGTTAGTITVSLYTPAHSDDCTGTPVFVTTFKAATGTGTYTSPNGFTNQKAGTWAWTASYSGDLNNGALTSTCGDETVKIGQAQSVLTTVATPKTATVGATLKDTVTLATLVDPGLGRTAGTVTLNLYTPTHATACTGIPVFTRTFKAATGNRVYMTPTGFVANKAGNWEWTAEYTGDTNNIGDTSTCGAEPVTVTKATPKIKTSPTPTSAVIGTTLWDTVTLTTLVDPLAGTAAGTITVKLYTPTYASSCTGTPVFATTFKAKLGNATYTSPAGFIADKAGTWAWTASYTGDSNNARVVSGCGLETLTVRPSIGAQLSQLLTAVKRVGPGASLATKVDQVIAEFNAGKIMQACATLSAFTSEVKAQTGKKVTATTAATLIARATHLRTEFGC